MRIGPVAVAVLSAILYAGPVHDADAALRAFGVAAPAVFPLGAIDFWFRSDSAIAAWLGGPHIGVTTVTGGGATEAGYIHGNGLGSMKAIGGPCGNDAGTVATCKTDIDNAVAAGADSLYVDEPPDATSTTVANFNTLAAYWHAHRPGGHFGIVNGNPDVNLHYLQQGLVGEDFVAWEDYAGTTPFGNPFRSIASGGNGLQTQFPSIKTMLLSFNSMVVCVGVPPYFDIYAFWDLDNFVIWGNVGLMDENWLTNANAFAANYAATGLVSPASNSFCYLPYSLVHSSSPAVATQTTNFTITSWNGFMQTGATSIVECQYKVLSGTGGDNGMDDSSLSVRVDWTDMTCSGTSPTITIGSSGNCNTVSVSSDPNNPGTPSLTCIVAVRAKNNLGVWGNTGYAAYGVQF